MSDILALDVGNVRIGVARANSIAKIAEPLTTLSQSEDIFKQLEVLINKHEVSTVVVGLPRSLDGNETKQTLVSRQFAGNLKKHFPHLNVVFSDEALTSHKAKQELHLRGRASTKGDIDALAATYILEDYLSEAGDYETIKN